MKNRNNLLYIGNHLTNKTGYNSVIAVLSNLLKEKYDVKVASNKLNKFLRLLDMCWKTIRLKNKIDYILIDTFSTSSFYYALIVSQLARFFKIKYIPILHGGNLPYRLEHSRSLSQMIFSYSYINVAPSQYLKSIFERKKYKVLFIPNILTITDYSFKFRESIKPNLLWVRAFDKIYNPLMAIEVLKNLKDLYPTAKLCMVGPFKDNSYQDVLDKIDCYKLNDCVEITGVLSKIEWIKKSEDFDIFINTTNFDNTPVSVMEAMALGLPIVSTNAGGLRFLIKDKEDGILVAKNDFKQMTKEVVKLIKTPLFANKLVMEARRKVELFDWNNVKEKWYEVLQ